MKKCLKYITATVIFVICFFLMSTESKAAEGTFYGYLFCYDTEGNLLAYSGASIVQLSTGEQYCITAASVYQENAVYIFGYDENMDYVEPVLYAEDYGLVLFTVPSFVQYLQQGTVENLTTETVLWQFGMNEEGAWGWVENYCVENSGILWRMSTDALTDFAAVPILGTPVIDIENETVIGILVDDVNNCFVDLDSFVAAYTGQGSRTETPDGNEGRGTGNGGFGNGSSDNGGSGNGGSGDGGSGSGGSDGGNSGYPATSSGNPISYGVLIFGMIVALGVLIYLFAKKNNNHNNAEREYAGLEELPTATPMALACVSGVHTGIVIPLDEIMVLGRDASRCNLVFPQGTQGISGIHCQVSRWNEKVELMDLGSTYGTYLENGTRLTPHMPYTINRGQGFYLGNKSYSYRIQ